MGDSQQKKHLVPFLNESHDRNNMGKKRNKCTMKDEHTHTHTEGFFDPQTENPIPLPARLTIQSLQSFFKKANIHTYIHTYMYTRKCFNQRKQAMHTTMHQTKTLNSQFPKPKRVKRVKKKPFEEFVEAQPGSDYYYPFMHPFVQSLHRKEEVGGVKTYSVCSQTPLPLLDRPTYLHTLIL